MVFQLSPKEAKFLKLVQTKTDGKLEIKKNLSLGAYSTYQTGGRARIAVFPKNIDQALILFKLIRDLDLEFTVIGGGSNILISDRGINGITVMLTGLAAFEIKGQLLGVEAGFSSHKLAHLALEQGLSGLEFLTQLPGSIGGAIYMNARAFGGEISKVIHSALVVDSSGSQLEYRNQPGDFSYKRSPFKLKDQIILKAYFKLITEGKSKIREEMDRIQQTRLAKQERKYPSCGCVFKNRRDLGKPAGKIIDEAGLKSLHTENARVYESHANFIVHNGRADSQEIRNLMELVKTKVRQLEGIELEYEVEFVGDWSEYQ
ncbi:MAG: UDP-N-acetylmuramate dehydrogenase [Deltaproteobacteria bacterium]|jgi:UDP-N-acetylmuramate dehydrogenase|nr:UDP-N-acetylmuramate dehydrogenase [Deltaproteobacteria bacterium]